MKSLLLFASAAVALLLSSCGGSGSDNDSKSRNKPDTSVITVATADAARLNSVIGNESSAIAVMLDIRAKESLMRARSLDATADLYISTIESIVDLPAAK